MNLIAMIFGYTIIVLVSLLLALCIFNGLVVSTSMFRWHYHRMKINGRIMGLRQWLQFLKAWFFAFLECADFTMQAPYTMSARDGQWEGVGKWKVWKEAIPTDLELQ